MKWVSLFVNLISIPLKSYSFYGQIAHIFSSRLCAPTLFLCVCRKASNPHLLYPQDVIHSHFVSDTLLMGSKRVTAKLRNNNNKSFTLHSKSFTLPSGHFTMLFKCLNASGKTIMMQLPLIKPLSLKCQCHRINFPEFTLGKSCCCG